ncbi:uncharacterized protein EDB91DRAFT_888872 [Suillus paluster]|uniref:uncharacterized protein n=1 Tax=Suillus paluster TaxID=48578 RepID=UPI001B885E72|nr:uncharacterized protein EDB91DRAFT_888872 [Suillus paluster]KAG1727672.1 hypothetical protein EDB91DRAFT_888872 [Suillus paluster]
MRSTPFFVACPRRSSTGQALQAIQEPTGQYSTPMFSAPSSVGQVVDMSSMTHPDDELTFFEDHDHLNMISSLNCPVRTNFSESPTLGGLSVRRFASPGRMNASNLRNVSTPANSSNYAANGYVDSSSPSTGHFSYHGQAASTQRQYPSPSFSTHNNHIQVDAAAIFDNTVPQNYPPTTNTIPNSHTQVNVIVRPQNSYTHTPAPNVGQYRGYSEPFYNPQNFRGGHYYNSAQGSIGVGLTPAAGTNLQPSYLPPMQYPNGYSPYSPQNAMPNTDAPSSSHREPSTYHPHRELSSYRSHPEPLAYDPEAYHGPRQQAYDPQLPGPSLPRQPAPPMAPDPSYWVPSSNSQSRQSPPRPPESHTQEAHRASAVFSCGWILGNGESCGFQGSRDAFKIHFTSNHLSGAQNSLSECNWQNCHYRKRGKPGVRVMRRDCLRRHVQETHLKVKRGA